MAFVYHRGEYLTDLLTGFKGVVVARMDNITGCNRYCVQPPLDKDGKFVDAQWIDEHSLQYDPAHLGKKVDLDRAKDEPPG